jgi:rod shape-determining protein MreD
VNPADSGPLHRLDAAARAAVPSLTALALIVLGVVPLRLPAFAAVVPWFALMAVYYWTMYRAELMPAPAVFGIGVFQDLLSGGPFGVNAFVLLLTHGAAMTQRRVLMRRPFSLGWLGFVAIALMGFALTWLTMTLLTLALFDPRAALVQYVLTVLLYPPVAWVFAAVHRAWVR